MDGGEWKQGRMLLEEGTVWARDSICKCETAWYVSKEHTSSSVHWGIKWKAGRSRNYKAQDLGNRRMLQILTTIQGSLNFVMWRL